jgi:protein-L-isoaspartate(D-aspartate) O-methyltransferase
MGQVPRHEFVPNSSVIYAYTNGPAPIGHGQTISQPYIVALMTDLLAPESDDVILEVGTGSGYQTAVLSRLAHKVYSVENIAALSQQAGERLQRLGYQNVELCAADGYYGWPEHAPYDGIIVTAAAPHVPEPLLAQLKPGGRLVIPVGGEYFGQVLMLIHKTTDGGYQSESVLEVVFVPLTGVKHDQPADL